MVQEFTPQTQMSQITLQKLNDSVETTILHSSLRQIPTLLSLWRGMLGICNKNLSPNQNR